MARRGTKLQCRSAVLASERQRWSFAYTSAWGSLTILLACGRAGAMTMVEKEAAEVACSSACVANPRQQARLDQLGRELHCDSGCLEQAKDPWGGLWCDYYGTATACRACQTSGCHSHGADGEDAHCVPCRNAPSPTPAPVSCVDYCVANDAQLDKLDAAGQILICDRRCLPGGDDPLYGGLWCNYFGKGQECRACDVSNCQDGPKAGKDCVPCLEPEATPAPTPAGDRCDCAINMVEQEVLTAKGYRLFCDKDCLSPKDPYGGLSCNMFGLGQECRGCSIGGCPNPIDDGLEHCVPCPATPSPSPVSTVPPHPVPGTKTPGPNGGGGKTLSPTLPPTLVGKRTLGPTPTPTRNDTPAPNGNDTPAPTGKATREPTQPPASEPTRTSTPTPSSPSTMMPTTSGTTPEPSRKPSSDHTPRPWHTAHPTRTGALTSAPTLQPMTAPPASLQPTVSPVTVQPTLAPVTAQPTLAPVTAQPTLANVTARPSLAPVTAQPTLAPGTAEPTMAPLTAKPTLAPVTAKPTMVPVTAEPTLAPVTIKPTRTPHRAPTSSPTLAPAGTTVVQGTSAVASVPSQSPDAFLGLAVVGIAAAYGVAEADVTITSAQYSDTPARRQRRALAEEGLESSDALQERHRRALAEELRSAAPVGRQRRALVEAAAAAQTCKLQDTSCDVSLSYVIAFKTTEGGPSAAQQTANAIDHLAVVDNYNSLADALGVPASSVKTGGVASSADASSPTTTSADAADLTSVEGQDVQVVDAAASGANYWVFGVVTGGLVVCWAVYMGLGYRRAKKEGLLAPKSEKQLMREEQDRAVTAAEVEDYVAQLQDEAEAEEAERRAAEKYAEALSGSGRPGVHHDDEEDDEDDDEDYYAAYGGGASAAAAAGAAAAAADRSVPLDDVDLSSEEDDGGFFVGYDDLATSRKGLNMLGSEAGGGDHKEELEVDGAGGSVGSAAQQEWSDAGSHSRHCSETVVLEPRGSNATSSAGGRGISALAGDGSDSGADRLPAGVNVGPAGTDPFQVSTPVATASDAGTGSGAGGSGGGFFSWFARAPAAAPPPPLEAAVASPAPPSPAGDSEY